MKEFHHLQHLPLNTVVVSDDPAELGQPIVMMLAGKEPDPVLVEFQESDDGMEIILLTIDRYFVRMSSDQWAFILDSCDEAESAFAALADFYDPDTDLYDEGWRTLEHKREKNA